MENLKKKITELRKKGYNNNQATYIAKSEEKKYATFGGIPFSGMNPQLQNYNNSNVSDILQPLDINLPTSQAKDLYDKEQQNPTNPAISLTTLDLQDTSQDNKYFRDSELKKRMGRNKANTISYNEDGYAEGFYNNQDNNGRVNHMQLYGGVDLEGALAAAGQGFGERNYWKAGLGTGLSLLKGTRNFMTGLASGRENRRFGQEYINKAFNEDPTMNYVPSPYQQGGKITNAQMLTNQYVADEGQGNINLENDEFVKRNDGTVQQVVGEPHIRSGKIAEGVNANLENGDKVLSNYIKLPATTIKELKRNYNLNLKRGATFADAQKQFDSKIGLKKETKQLESLIENLGKNEDIKDEATRRLNESVISKKITEQNEKLQTLKQPQSMFFEELFAMQEMIPKKGDGTQLFDKNGKEVTEVAQQGGKYYQQGGQEQDEVLNFVMQSLQEGVDPNEIVQQLVQVGIPQEQAEQLVQSLLQPQQGMQLEKMMQQGGEILAMASKYGISPERAQELIQLAMQQGGEMPNEEQMMAQEQGGEEEQIMMFIVQSLEQGVPPEQILQQLVEQGIPQEVAQQMVQAVMQGGQEQSMSEEEQMMMQEQGQMMQYGGKVKKYAQEGDWKKFLNEGQTYGRGAEKIYVEGAFEEPNYKYESIPNIAERFKFLAEQRGVKYDDLDLTTRKGINTLATRTQQWDKKNLPGLTQDYGMNIGLTKQGIDAFLKNEELTKSIDKNLLDKLKKARRGTYELSEFTKEDRDSIMSVVSKSSDKSFADKNYLDNQAYFRGIDTQIIYFDDEEDFKKYKEEKGKSIDGYYKTDKKGIYVKPILLKPRQFETQEEKDKWVEANKDKADVKHKDFFSENNDDVFEVPFVKGEPATTPPAPKESPSNDPKINPAQNLQYANEKTKQVLPWIPLNLRLAPSPLRPIAKEQVYLPRIEPIKGTSEPMLAEAERMRQTDVDRMQRSGLTPQQQQALMAQGLAASQLASNDAISKVEQFNVQNQFQSDQFNIGQRSKEDITNAAFRQDYEKRALGSLANQERDWRNYFIEGNMQNRQNYLDIENANLSNADKENYQYLMGSGVQFNPSTAKAGSISIPDVKDLSDKQFMDFIKKVVKLREGTA